MSENIGEHADKSHQNSGIIGKDGRKMHANSLLNLDKGKFVPGDPRINKNGRPRREFSWTEVIAEIGDETNPETQRSNRETLIRDLYRLALDGDTPVTTRYSIAVWLTEREDGKAVQKQEISSKGLVQNVILLPAKHNENNNLQASYEVINEEDES